MVIAPFVRTAALVVILFLIIALLSRMSATEVQVEVSVQHVLKKLINKSYESHVRANQAPHPIHKLIHLTQALNYVDSALHLTSVKHCENITKCPVQQFTQQLEQEQENVAVQLSNLIKPVQPM